MNDDRLNDDRMNERIVEALRRRPADEPAFERPLRLPARGEETAEPLTGLVPSLGLGRADGRRPTVRSRTPIGALLAMVLLVAVVAVTLFAWRPAGTPAAASPTAQAVLTFTPTDRVTCGWTATYQRGTLPAGSCDAYGVLPDGYERVVWTLDPAFPLSANSRLIHVLVREWCQAYDLSGPVVQHVDLDADRVLLTLATRPAPRAIPSGASIVCPDVLRLTSPAADAYVVELAEPLGHRAVYDAEPDPMKLMATADGVAVVSPTVAGVTPAPAATPLLYTVKASDRNLTSIASRYNTTVAAIVAYNAQFGPQFEIRDPNVMWVGRQIYLPPAGWTPGGPMPPSSPTTVTLHQPMDCAGVNQDVDLGGFYKRVSMDLPFDVYCPVLPAGWTAKPGDGGQAGIEKDGWIRMDYQGPNGQTFELMQGAFCEAASSMICDRIAGPSGTTELGGRSAKLGGAGDRWFAYTAPESGAMWEADGTGMTRDEFLALLATLVVVAK